ncbi:gamma-glutamylcyclotransferase family protein [Clostridium sp. LIBA-8841]|uniref:gamma-glutamylcyclotransferase family protein n=1 Tax=Clostridium sp. LIBA-8841 TaxID=2987530 RepID=UPI002AC3F182|nr:gamma-glutamylcyclotransferase family protein [Clostridium sp. LIBA-8841]MDZ5254461.1 gamma-glutamylcyclotransferase [Clostridium sp. LIBA-8841]
MVYFAYGSNLSLEQIKRRCPEAIPMVRVYLEDYKLVYNKYADIIPCQGERVYGAIYELSINDLKNLDEFEGYPYLYEKINLKVQDSNGVFYEAFAYVMVEKGNKLPEDDYLDIINKGYQDWNIVL